ncbi:MAG: LicD family protein [Proteobacteria bacterium]|nr:LicD family protein [Pseudomonadota bacterium]
MSGHHTLEGANLKKALKLLDRVTGCLDKSQVSYWLEGGTLLGVVRENRLLPWDNDLDISVKENDYEKLIQCIPKIKKLGYRVKTKSFEKDDPPFNKDKIRIIKVRSRRFFFFRGKVCLDIFIKFRKDEIYYWRVKDTKKSVPAEFYNELVTWPFNHKTYFVPKDYDGYLTYRYGNWRIPVKEWDTFSDDKALN